MAFTTSLDEFVYGASIQGAYVRLHDFRYSVSETRWNFKLTAYFSRESRDYEKLCLKLAAKFGISMGLQQMPPRPDIVTSDELWAKIVQMSVVGISEGVRKVAYMEHWVMNSELGIEGLTLDEVSKKIYTHIKSKHYNAGVDDFDEPTDEDLMKKFLPEATFTL